MSKNRNRIIDVISGIDEALVDRATEKRIKFFESRNSSRGKKKYAPIIAIAAAISLFMGLMLAVFIPMFLPQTEDPNQPGIKQAPIYTGMTASGTVGEVAYAGGIKPLSAVIPLDNQNTEGNNGNHGSNNPNKKPVKDIIEAPTTEAETTVLPDGTIEVVPQNELYYAKPNEDIFITIHFDNPDEYKIMSFKLNGTAYADYMFEYGSDYENIIIKVNVGDVEGLIDYTIDAIQYADRETLKYVEMKGDPTLTIGVATAKQPVAEVTDETVNINDMSFSVTVSDEIGLIGLTNGNVKAVISDGESIVAEQKLTVGETSAVKFENLKTSTYYEFAIVAVYDALDGEGFINHVIYSKEITTREVVSFSEVTSTKTSISFATVFNEDAETKEITKIELYLGEEKVRNIDITETEITDLLSNNEYRIVVFYTNKGATETIEYTVKTLEKATPTVEITQKGESTQTSFEFDLVYTDNDGIGTITKLELLHGDDEPINVKDLETRGFTDLLSNNEYTVRVTFVYDLNDGIGERTATEELAVKTKAKSVPIVGLNDYTSDFKSVSFSISEISDPDNIGEIIKAELYNPDGTKNRELELNAEIVLDDLVLMDNYQVVITFRFDANDGCGTFERKTNVTVATASSEGFELTHGNISGIGTCKDTVLYINKNVGYYAFDGNTNITKVIFSNNVTSVETAAFEGCTNLEEVVFGTNLVNIHSDAFKNCTKLSGDVDLKYVKNIYSGAFKGCIGIERVILGENIEILGQSAFMDCTDLLEVVNISKVKEIEALVFCGCESLRGTIDLSSAKTIGASAFRGCENITGITLGSQIESILDVAFSDCKKLSGTPDLSKVKIIGSYAFENCKDISGIIDLSSAEEIGLYAFSGCKRIEGVVFGNSLSIIGNNAFENCEKLSGKINLSNVSTIGDNAFYKCTNISGVLDLSNAERIGHSAFWMCENIEGVIFGHRLKEIADSAFFGCTKLSGEIDLSRVTNIGDAAFSGCENLTGSLNLSRAKNIGSSAFFGCSKLSGTLDLSNAETVGASAFEGCSNIEGVIFGSELDVINEYAFDGCINLCGTLDLSFVEKIKIAAFNGCSKIEGVILGNDIELIQGQAFFGCVNLSSIDLSRVGEIGSHAFYDCKKLSGILDLSGAIDIGDYAFSNITGLEGVILGKDLESVGDEAFEGVDVYYMGSEADWENSVEEGFRWNSVSPSEYEVYYNYTVLS